MIHYFILKNILNKFTPEDNRDTIETVVFDSLNIITYLSFFCVDSSAIYSDYFLDVHVEIHV